MNIALIKNGKVANIIVADLVFANKLGFDQAIDTAGHVVGIGDGWNGQIFTKPEPAPESITENSEIRFSQMDFFDLFKQEEELEVIYTLAKDNVKLQIAMDKFKMADYISNKDPRTIANINSMEALGLIAPGRAAQILAGIKAI